MVSGLRKTGTYILRPDKLSGAWQKNPFNKNVFTVTGSFSSVMMITWTETTPISVTVSMNNKLDFSLVSFTKTPWWQDCKRGLSDMSDQNPCSMRMEWLKESCTNIDKGKEIVSKNYKKFPDNGDTRNIKGKDPF